MQIGQTLHSIRWQVLILFSCLCHVVTGQLSYSIVEEMRKGSLIGNMAKDLGMNVKDLSVRKLRIVSRLSEKYFSLNLENGNLYIAERIDRETLCGTAADCVMTFDAVTENPFNVVNVKIEIQDVNDNPPRFLHEIIRLEISEFALPGARFVLQKAEDSDIGMNTLKSYRLSTNEHFVLGERISSDGSIFPELVLEKPLDRETEDYHEVILSAFDGGKPALTGSTLIKIMIIDFNDNTPLFTQDLYKIAIKENIPLNSTVLQVSATDGDEGVNAQITYSFSTMANNILQMFEINPGSGAITTKGQVDYELTKHYEVSIQAIDGGGLAAYSKVLIEVLDQNDNAPEISIASLTSPIPENTTSGTVVALIEVHDQDSGENGEVQCLITDDVPFQIQSSASNFYKITTKSSLDREKMSSYNITIQASDKGSPPMTAKRFIQLVVSDVNDNAPEFEKLTYTAFIPENNIPGTSILSVLAKDIDSENNAKVIYSISGIENEKEPMSSFISINRETGVIYALRSFDYELQKEFSFHINAKDNGNPPLNSSTTLRISIVDHNDNSPVILYPSADSAFELVPWASNQGSLISKVVAVDADSGHNSWLSYFLQTSEPSFFSIDQHTGEIRTARIFQEKDAPKHSIVVIVKDNGYPPLSASATLNLVIAENFQQVIPEMTNQTNRLESQSNLQFYLVIALALISFLFLLTVILAIISKYRESKSSSSFGALAGNLYPTVDPRFLSQFNNGTLPLPYSYDVCVTLDSSERDFAFLRPKTSVPVDHLIDTDDSGIGNENSKDSLFADNITSQVCFS